MSAVIRRFERRDRDQLTALVNLHVAAVIPGVTLSVNTVLSQLEREPDEHVVDPWVAERYCLVAEKHHRIVAAALLHRFRDDPDVGDSYRKTGDIRWLVCGIDTLDDGRELLDAAVAVMRRWQVSEIGAECALPAPGCYGIPDAMPHLRALLAGAGFGAAERSELVLAARCSALIGHDSSATVVRSVGVLGTRFTLLENAESVGYIEVCPPGADLARNPSGTHWADVGNLILADDAEAATVFPVLLSSAANWLLLGGVTMLIDYWATGEDPLEHLDVLENAGFRTLVRNDRGFRRAV